LYILHSYSESATMKKGSAQHLNLSFPNNFAGIGFGTYSFTVKIAIGGCQGFTGPVPPPFFISLFE
jgi:hypothetical protein